MALAPPPPPPPPPPSARAEEFVRLDGETLHQRHASKKRKQKHSSSLELPATSVNKTSVVYIGRIPHGFYEEQMRSYFVQFGKIKRLRISRNKKTGKSKHYGFIEFESPEVAEIVAESMNNYLLFEHMLQARLVPSDKIHPRMWAGANRIYKPPNWQRMERSRINKERGPEEHKKLVNALLKRDKERRKKIKAAGIEYDYPDLRQSLPAVPKKIKFVEIDEKDDSAS